MDQRGLLFRDGMFQKILGPGRYSVGNFLGQRTIAVYNVADEFLPLHKLAVLLEHPALKQALDVIEVADDEIVLLYEGGNFKQALKSGLHAFWKSGIKRVGYS